MATPRSLAQRAATRHTSRSAPAMHRDRSADPPAVIRTGPITANPAPRFGPAHTR